MVCFTEIHWSACYAAPISCCYARRNEHMAGSTGAQSRRLSQKSQITPKNHLRLFVFFSFRRRWRGLSLRCESTTTKWTSNQSTSPKTHSSLGARKTRRSRTKFKSSRDLTCLVHVTWLSFLPSFPPFSRIRQLDNIQLIFSNYCCTSNYRRCSKY